MSGEVAMRSAVLHSYLQGCSTQGIDPQAGCRDALERWAANGSVAGPPSPSETPESREEGARRLQIVKAVLRSAKANAIAVSGDLVDALMDWAWHVPGEARDA